MREVQLEGHVLLKMIKHCKQATPNVVSGTLLGLDVQETLEVTASFPMLDAGTEEESREVEEYQFDTLQCLRTVNVDCYVVGWYQSTYLSSYLNENWIQTQFSHQENLDQCVGIIYDPVLSADGKLLLKAVRLTDSFMELYRSQNFTRESLRQFLLKGDDIVQEIPIRIHNLHIIQGALWDLAKAPVPERDMSFSMLDTAVNPFLTKNLHFTLECIDDLSTEHSKLQYYHRSLGRQRAQQDMRRRELENKTDGKMDEEDKNLFKPLQEPSRLESLLITNQISNHCSQLGSLAGWARQ